MKTITTLIAASLLASGSFAEALEEWLFDDAVGTSLQNTTNTGSVGSSWNFGGPQVQNGNLNIGDTLFYKWGPGSNQTFRTVSFPELTTGKYIFEYVIADWDLAGTDGIGVVNNGIKFNFGHTTNGSAQLEFEVAQAPSNDIRVRSQNSSNGNLSGTDAQNQLGGLNLTNTAPVTVQLLVDLDSGEWSTQVNAGNGFVPLVTDGTGMTMLNRIQLIVDASNGTWEFGGVGGTATEFVMIDSISLSVPEADPWIKQEYWDFEPDAANQSFGTNWINSGELNSEWDFGGPAEIATDGAGSLVVSNHAGQMFRNLPKAGTANADPVNSVYAVPFTSGRYRMVLDFASWDLPDGDDSGNIELQALSNTNLVASIRLRVNTAGNATWIQLMGLEDGSPKYNTYGQGEGSTNKTTATSTMIEFDLDENTIEYFINGESKKATNTFNIAGFDRLTFTTSENWSSNNVVEIESMGFSKYMDPNATNTPTSLWLDWLGGFDMGADTNLLDNADEDLLDNLTEYAFGGEPDNSSDQGNTPIQSAVEENGTNYIEYVYYERDDKADRGLESVVQVGTDLVNPDWTNANFIVVGSGDSGIPGFNAVTNRISTEEKDKQFIRLQIKFTP